MVLLDDETIGPHEPSADVCQGEQEISIEALLAKRWDATCSVRPGSRIVAVLRRAGRIANSRWRAVRLQSIRAASGVLSTNRIVKAASEFRGEFELDLRSDVTRRLLLWGFEPEIVPLFRSACTGDVIDVGSNVGLYSVLAGKLLGDRGRVLAIEPTPSILPLLRSNLHRNGVSNVLLFEGVATREPGKVDLTYVEGSEEYTSLGASYTSTTSRRFERHVSVAAETLDRLVLQNGISPRLIKIDVEGAEGLVLSGAESVLRDHHPIVVSELDDRMLSSLGWTSAMIADLLWAAGYRIFNAYTGEQYTAHNLPRTLHTEIAALPG